MNLSFDINTQDGDKVIVSIVSSYPYLRDIAPAGDENIFLGTDHQTGTYADFSTHPGPYIISKCVQSIFLPELRDMAKKHHGTRIKSIDVDNNLDHIDLVITY